MKLLFNLVDIIFNPKSDLRNDKEKSFTPVLLKHFFPDETILRESDLERLQEVLKTHAKTKKVERLKDLRSIEVHSLVALFNKADKENINEDFALATIDREFPEK